MEKQTSAGKTDKAGDSLSSLIVNLNLGFIEFLNLALVQRIQGSLYTCYSFCCVSVLVSSHLSVFTLTLFVFASYICASVHRATHKLSHGCYISLVHPNSEQCFCFYGPQ